MSEREQTLRILEWMKECTTILDYLEFLGKLPDDVEVAKGVDVRTLRNVLTDLNDKASNGELTTKEIGRFSGDRYNYIPQAVRSNLLGKNEANKPR